MKKKRIIVIFTGGTISMAKDNETKTNQIIDNQNELIHNISNELDHVDIVTKTFSLKPSPAMTPSDMFELAKLVKSYLNDPQNTGVVITHGTDTLEESAYFLDLYISSEKPVVFTGAMRSYSELGFDGYSNLVSSILVAANEQSINKGVLVCLNDEINTASEVTKSHTLALDTFKSLEFGPIGIVEQENVIYTRLAPRRSIDMMPNKIETNVEVIKVTSGSSSFILNLLIKHQIKGIVIEALGRGNVPPQMVDGIKKAIDLNIPIVITSRCPKGRVLGNYGYVGGGHHLKELGVIFTNNLSAQKAKIRLMLALGLTSSIQKLKKLF